MIPPMKKTQVFIETGEQDMLPYLIDEELVYLERHSSYSELREILWKNILYILMDILQS